MQAYVDRGMGNRLTKRYAFLKENRKDYLDKICS